MHYAAHCTLHTTRYTAARCTIRCTHRGTRPASWLFQKSSRTSFPWLPIPSGTSPVNMFSATDTFSRSSSSPRSAGSVPVNWFLLKSMI
jgi:hypothetical protein